MVDDSQSSGSTDNFTDGGNSTSTVGNSSSDSNSTDNSTTDSNSTSSDGTTAYNGTQLLRKNNNNGIWLKKINKINRTLVTKENATDEKFTIEEKTLLIRNASNPKVWFTGDKDQPIILAYDAPSSDGQAGNSLYIMQYSNLDAMR
jgi:hypothetical protein